MHYIIYKTTNLLNGMHYVGSHQTENLNDGYLGSGKHLKRAILKYGKENFKFEILYSLSSKEEMFDVEREIVNESFVTDPLTYNLKIGGSGGNPSIVGAFKGRKHSTETKEKIRNAALQQVTSEEKRKKLSKNCGMKRKEIAEKVSKSLTGRLCSDEHKKRVAEANLGKILVNNGIIARRISKDDLANYEKLGWTKGGLPRKNISR
jgi:group I intron endonuclease